MFLDYLCLIVVFNIQSTKAYLSIVITFFKPAEPMYYKTSDFNKQMFIITCFSINTLSAFFYSLKIVFSNLFLYYLLFYLNLSML